MRNLGNFLLAFFTVLSFSARSQQSQLILSYIQQYKDVAIEEMKRTGVPASIKLAQGIFETTAGTSKLVLASNNHFGIKCKSTWTGESVKHDDDLRNECFRKYPTALDSYKDHSDFLRNNQRYSSLFALDPYDYKGWAYGLKKAGYATNSRYPQALIKIIEDYNLQTYSNIVLLRDPIDSSILATVNTNPPITKPAPPVEVVEIKKPVYPPGEFKINDTKVVFAEKGTSYLSIAKKYDVDLSKIFEFNEIERTEQTAFDQLVYLQRKRKTSHNEFHTVLPGESLHSIAQLHAIRLESLRELNWLKGDEKPAPGEILHLQKKSSAMPRLAVKENYSLVPAGKNTKTN